MSTPPRPGDGAYAEFDDKDAARQAVRSLEELGVPRTRIFVDHAPDQDPTPIDTEERDKRILSRLAQFFVGGAIAGLVAGAVVGALAGLLIWGTETQAWTLLAVGAALFGMGLGVLWSLLIGKGESDRTPGTVYDRPAAAAPITIIARPEDGDDVDDLLRALDSVGGQNLQRVPADADLPER